MLKPTRTILALATGSLVLGLVGAGVSVADEGPVSTLPAHETAAGAAAYRSVIGKVVSRGALTVRSKPTTRSESVGKVYPNRTVEIDCKKYGESVDGNRIWYRLADGTDDWQNGENGQNGQNGENGQNGQNGNGDWQNGPAAKGRQYGAERWVAARYVKNQSPVQYCR
ncbi:SH3 domain-containing protein [Streptomyces xanthophaeus]|uniref:SH3 domain-containing protein n=1 Tax=Streptomyces xanthophaeus TaxID=67385 RepID=UPI00068D83DF|nr:SH3 domain-containing protein [Streptomyces xanthophaeus]